MGYGALQDPAGEIRNDRVLPRRLPEPEIHPRARGVQEIPPHMGDRPITGILSEGHQIPGGAAHIGKRRRRPPSMTAHSASSRRDPTSRTGRRSMRHPSSITSCGSTAGVSKADVASTTSPAPIAFATILSSSSPRRRRQGTASEGPDRPTSNRERTRHQPYGNPPAQPCAERVGAENGHIPCQLHGRLKTHIPPITWIRGTWIRRWPSTARGSRPHDSRSATASTRRL